jgi:hypothetical protein
MFSFQSSSGFSGMRLRRRCMAIEAARARVFPAVRIFLAFSCHPMITYRP